MPRQARVKSETGIYHIMLRGINQQQIFEDEEDNLKFIQILKDYKTICRYKIYAYCLMGNHVHLLIKEEFDEIQQIIKRIAGKHVYWYNGKYERIGHLFQDRFKSEPVEDDKYFLTVLRYIHQNPVKARIVEKIEEYAYSSYNEYLNGGIVVDREFVNGLLKTEQYIDFHKENEEKKCLDVEERPHRLTDEAAKRIIVKLSKCNNITEFQRLDTKKRDKLISEFKKEGFQ